jgi:hypothetical protein
MRIHYSSVGSGQWAGSGRVPAADIILPRGGIEVHRLPEADNWQPASGN